MVGWINQPCSTLGPVARAAAEQRGVVFFLADADVVHHPFELAFIDQRSDVGGFFDARTEAEFGGAGHQALDQPVVDRRVDDQAAGGRAALAGGAEGAPERAFDGQVEIGVVHDDFGVLAAAFQRHPFARASAFGGDVLAGFGRAGDRDQADFGITAHRFADRRAAALHQVDDAAGHSGVSKGADELGAAHGRVGGRLEDNGVAADQGVERFPGGNGHGKVPRRDQSADADRLADGEAELVGQFRRGRVAVEASAFAGGQFGHVDGLLHVAAAFGDGLAGLACDPLADGLFALGEDFTGAAEDGRAGRRRSAPPGGIGPGRRLDGAIEFGSRRVGRLADDLARIGGVARINRRGPIRPVPLSVNEVQRFCGGCHLIDSF